MGTMTRTRLRPMVAMFDVRDDADAPTDAAIAEAMGALGCSGVVVWTEEEHRQDTLSTHAGEILDRYGDDIRDEIREEQEWEAFDALADTARAFGWELRHTGAAVVTLSGAGRVVMSPVGKRSALLAAVDCFEQMATGR